MRFRSDWVALRVAQHRTALICVSLALVVNGVLAVHTASRMSVTHDEYWHLPIGLQIWRSGRFDLARLNPPLGLVWAALPLVFTANDVTIGEQTPNETKIGDLFLATNRDHYEQMFLAGRCMIVVLSVVTGAVLAAWSWNWFGSGAA